MNVGGAFFFMFPRSDRTPTLGKYTQIFASTGGMWKKETLPRAAFLSCHPLGQVIIHIRGPWSARGSAGLVFVGLSGLVFLVATTQGQRQLILEHLGKHELG